jgi:sec-independent protein translocase protein TatC
VLVTFPFLLYLAWGFVSPALEEKTEKYGLLMIFFSSILFWSGVALCWFTVFENMLAIFPWSVHLKNVLEDE